MNGKNRYTQCFIALYLIFGFVFSQNIVFAQNENEKSEPTLTFFSEDGIRFWVSINGEKQNNIASSNVKIPATKDTWVKAKIIFENEGIPEISKNVAMSKEGDVVYRIKKTRKKYVVRLYSTPENYVEGTENVDNETLENVSDNTSTCYFAMSSESFSKAYLIVQKETFEAIKLSTSKQIADNNCLSTEQIKSLLKTYSFEATRVEFAKYAYSRCSDKKNYYLLNEAFEYEASKIEIADFVKRK